MRAVSLLLWLLLLLLLPSSQLAASASNFLKSAALTTTVHRRQRRYLIFEKGSTIYAQINVGKTIVDSIPNGLSQIFEFTLAYDLPTSIQSVWREHKYLHRLCTTTVMPTPLLYWHHGQPTSAYSYEYSMKPQCKSFRSSYMLKDTKRCTVHNHYTNFNGVKYCTAKISKKMQRFKRSPLGGHNIFLDFLGKFAELHGYQPRYCIMRTLCESHHLLLPNGRSLFHDILRILLRYSLPFLSRYQAFRNAYGNYNNLQQCALLYGPHCRQSFFEQLITLFLDKFTR